MKRAEAKFEVGKTYKYGWAGDADLVSFIVCVKRTAKTITFDEDGEIVTRRVKNDAVYGEWIEPKGSYSMSPICRANRVVSN